jgi:hypothetical protein
MYLNSDCWLQRGQKAVLFFHILTLHPKTAPKKVQLLVDEILQHKDIYVTVRSGLVDREIDNEGFARNRRSFSEGEQIRRTWKISRI